MCVSRPPHRVAVAGVRAGTAPSNRAPHSSSSCPGLDQASKKQHTPTPPPPTPDTRPLPARRSLLVFVDLVLLCLVLVRRYTTRPPPLPQPCDRWPPHRYLHTTAHEPAPPTTATMANDEYDVSVPLSLRSSSRSSRLTRPVVSLQGCVPPPARAVTPY